MAEHTFLFYGTPDDASFLHCLKPHIGGHKCYTITSDKCTTFFEIESYCKNRGITGIFSTSQWLLSKCTGNDSSKINDFAGSYFTKGGIEIVFLDPLEQVMTVPYGKFMLARYTSKLVARERWLQNPEFKWKILRTQDDYNHALDWLSNSILIGLDIETFKNPLSIRCVGYTGLQISEQGVLSTYSFVIALTDVVALQWVRQLNSLAVPKVTQNGKYDHSYLSRYDATCIGWLWDTATMMHSWYCELPKDLASLQAFFVREAFYWKDLAESRDLETYYLYNAKDTWATVLVAWAWIHESPEWAKQNYLKEFPINFPAHMSEMIGIPRDMARLESARGEVDAMIEKKLASLRNMLGEPHFNPNSPKQVVALWKTLGCGDIQSSGDKEQAKVAYRHPLNARIVEAIRGIPKSDDPEHMGLRALSKVKGNYLRLDSDADKKGEGGAKEFNGRVLYALNPHGTDSGRLASKEHHFWCGLQLQNIPGGALVKQTLRAPEGFYFGESDLEQAETRDTAYITGDTNLIAAVSSEKDFHALNTAAFFGVPYESIYDDALKKVINKTLRNLAKRVNHGANYNMGPQVMVDTIGEKMVYEAGRLLNLPRHWSAIEITTYLLEQFGKTYPVVRHDYQEWIIATVVTTKLLVGGTGWTRYCFNDPRKSKPALNSYIAHPSQSLNAMVLNMAFKRVFYDIAINPKYAPYFRLVGQIHDSIPFFYHKDHLYLPDMVKERMEIPLTIKDIKGVERTFTVPAALKIGKTDAEGNLKRAIYWADTE